jgi:hypothetical protein
VSKKYPPNWIVGTVSKGYDIRKRFEGSVGFFWQANFQQIYRELGKLEEQGLVRSEAIASNLGIPTEHFILLPQRFVSLRLLVII